MPRQRGLIFVLWGLILAVVALAGPPEARATLVLPLNLEEMSGRADKIFIGECESVVEGSDAKNFPATFITYRVLEMIKGESTPRISFKQYGVLQNKLDRFRDSSATVEMTPYIYGQVTHAVGERAIIFLRGDSELGFSGVVGMGQGKFLIRKDAAGTAIAENEFHNAFCYRRMKKGSPLADLKRKMMRTQGTATGPLPCHDLVGTLKEIVGRQQGVRP